MSTLIDNLSSDYFGGFAHLLPKSKPKSVVVYVESDSDISFWRNILHKHESSGVKFDICLPSKSTLTKNKKAALSRSVDLLNHSGIGKFLLICVDSDYDYLLNDYYSCPDKKSVSNKMDESIYIFQTYSYSMENLKCFSKSLYCICVNVTNKDTEIVDFEEFLSSYSEIIYSLFLWNLYFYSAGLEAKFTIKNFCSFIKIDKYDYQDDSYGLRSLKEKIDEKTKELEGIYPELIERVSTLGLELQEKGLYKRDAYLFVQGHTLFDNVVLILLKSISKKVKSEKIDDIKRLARHDAERDTQLNSYANQVKGLDAKIENLLTSNSDFSNCHLFKKIEKDIKKYLNQELNVG